MNVTDIANVAHSVNAAYCHATGDDSQLPWDQAPDWQKESAIKGVEFIQANPSASPSASHDSWLEEKRKDSWKYGAVKDPIKKEHPCYVPYEELPVEQKAKDYIFGAVVRSLIPHLNMHDEPAGLHKGILPEVKGLRTEKLSDKDLLAVLTAHGIPAPTHLQAPTTPKVVTSFTADGRQVTDLSQMTAPKLA